MSVCHWEAVCIDNNDGLLKDVGGWLLRSAQDPPEWPVSTLVLLPGNTPARQLCEGGGVHLNRRCVLSDR
jgi:hypothetical protein